MNEVHLIKAALKNRIYYGTPKLVGGESKCGEILVYRGPL
jgi:hypothetical protein